LRNEKADQEDEAHEEEMTLFVNVSREIFSQTCHLLTGFFFLCAKKLI